VTFIEILIDVNQMQFRTIFLLYEYYRINPFFSNKKLLKCFIALFCSMFGKTITVTIKVIITVSLKPGGQNHPRSRSISQCQALNDTPVRYSQDSNCSGRKMVDCDQLKFGQHLGCV